MADIMTAVTSLVGNAIDWMKEFLTAITTDTSGVLLTFCVALPLVGLGISLLSRLLSIRA